MATEIRRRVIDLIADQMGADHDSIDEGTHLHNDLGVDSLDMSEIVVELEEEFDIIIDQDDTIQTVGQVIDYVAQNAG